MPVSYFFEGLPTSVQERPLPSEPDAPDRMTSRETLELVRAYYRILDPGVRKRLVDLARALGREEQQQDG